MILLFYTLFCLVYFYWVIFAEWFMAKLNITDKAPRSKTADVIHSPLMPAHFLYLPSPLQSLCNWLDGLHTPQVQLAESAI